MTHEPIDRATGVRLAGMFQRGDEAEDVDVGSNHLRGRLCVGGAADHHVGRRDERRFGFQVEFAPELAELLERRVSLLVAGMDQALGGCTEAGADAQRRPFARWTPDYPFVNVRVTTRPVRGPGTEPSGRVVSSVPFGVPSATV